MNFVVVGLNHKTAPVEIREQAFIPAQSIGDCVQRLIDRHLIESGVLLSTCNRTELYAVATQADPHDRLIEAFGLWPHQLSFADWRRHAYGVTGAEALDHLFRVAAGLESMVVGEGQVLGQLKGALALARAARVTDARLEIVLRGAIRAGKRVRHETPLSRGAVSVSHAAVAIAAQGLAGLRGRGVLVLGAGAMSEIALRLLRNCGIGEVYVASRTRERADRVARPVHGRAIPMDRLEEIADRIDLILSSSAAPHHLLDAGQIEAMQARRSHRPLFVIDMAVPRDIDPPAGNVTGVTLVDIDDLQMLAERNRDDRLAWIPTAESIIAEEVALAARALETRDASDAIARVVSRAESMRDQVLEQHLQHLAGADSATRASMRELANALTARLIHGPVQALRDSGDDALERAIISEAFAAEARPS